MTTLCTKNCIQQKHPRVILQMCLVAGGDPHSQTRHRNRLFSGMVNILASSLKLCPLILSMLPQSSQMIGGAMCRFCIVCFLFRNATFRKVGQHNSVM